MSIAMIVSHKHRFIFVHCRKAAGSSVALSLSRYLGSNDLQFSAITDGARMKVYPPRRVVREALSFMRPADVLAVLIGRKSFWGQISTAIKGKYAPFLGNSSAHAPAAVVASCFPDEWREYFKFCIVRNPWDKTLSDYFWRTKRLDSPPSFEEFVTALEQGDSLAGIVPKNHSNWEMFTIDNVIAVDYVVRFEELASGLVEALAKTSVAWDGWLPHMKKGGTGENGRPRRDYRDHYSEQTASAVSRLYRKEIEAFGYRF